MRRHSLFRLLAALLLTTALTFTLTSSIRALERARSETERVSAALNDQLARKLSECQRLGRKMAVMGADIRGTLLPELQKQLYALEALNACASEGTLDCRLLLRKISDTGTRLSACYAAGAPSDALERTLIDYLSQLDGVFASHAIASARGASGRNLNFATY